MQELIHEQIGEQISTAVDTAVKALFDSLMKHLDFYFAPDGAVGKLTADVHKLSDAVRDADQQTKAQGLAILRLEKQARGDGDLDDHTGLFSRPLAPPPAKLSDPPLPSASTAEGNKAKIGSYP